MIKKDKIVELLTYILVPTVFFVIFPLAAKLIDKYLLKQDHIITSNIYFIITGILIIMCGYILGFYTIFLFKKYGKGTPNPTIPPKKFVIKGPYKHVRNPMALGGTIILLGESLLYYSISLFIITALYTCVINIYIINIEEPVLIKRFGRPYREYLDHIPRFIPFKIKK
jgi:protein-S-isoprenylcysteine O-methyltransferase Ste14